MGQVEEENGGEIDLPPSEIIKEGENNYDKYWSLFIMGSPFVG